MKSNPRALPAILLSLPWVLAGGHVADKPSYQPEAGATLVKHFAIESELELEDMTLEIDGTDMSEMAQMEIAMKVAMKLDATDRYETVTDGRPTKLKRSYDEISSTTHVSSSNAMAGDQEHDIPLASELEGTTVVFTWEDGEYGVAFEGDQKGDEELLEDLAEDLDLRGFLPSADVSEGDSWKVPVEAVKAAIAPGGDLKLRAEDGADAMSSMNQFSPHDMMGDLQGEFEAAYTGTRDVDGKRVAVIKLDLTGKSAQDMTDAVKEQMKGQLPEGAQADVSAVDGEYEFELEGELLWDLATNLVHELHLSGEVRMIIDMSMNMSMGERSQSMDVSQTYAGNQTISLTTGE